MYKKRFDLDVLFNPKSVVIVGASHEEEKVGHVILKNYIDSGYTGKLYPVNRNADVVIGLKAYKKVTDIKDKIDLAVIAVPADFVPEVLEDCGKAKIRCAVVVSGGFSEIGRTDLQDKIVKIANKNKIAMIGPNCLGVMDTRSRVDTLFLPTYKLSRPGIGSVSFVAQSGAVGSTILDLIAGEGFGLAKFISYGNAAVVDEADILHYLMNDKDTKVIVMYIEGINRGKAFLEVAKEVTKKKPVIVLKGGVTAKGADAAHSHTAALAGSYEAYEAVFRQFGFTIAHDLKDLLYFAKMLNSEPFPKGKRVGIITNGGGAGVLTTDEIYMSGLELAEFSNDTKKKLAKVLPSLVNIKNPLDIVGDADDKRYGSVIDLVNKDPNVDMLIVIALFQTPGADSKVATMLVHYKNNSTKPLIVLSIGAEYTKAQADMMEMSGLPVYDSPAAAASSLAELLKYSEYISR